MNRSLARLGADRAFGAGNVAIALIIGLTVFRALPARSIWLVVAAIAVMALLLTSGVGLAARTTWAARLAHFAGLALLLFGALATAVLVLGMVFYRSIGGPGAGPGPALFAVALLLVLPYALVYPAGLLLWLDSRTRPAS
jgi:hypothetical protein